MTHDQQELLSRFHKALVREIQATNPDYLAGPFSVAEIYQNLVPYRTHRDEIGVEMNGDYEHALLQLLAGDGDYLTIESRTARQEIREELESPNPNTGLYRDFAAADVRLNPEKTERALEGWEAPEPAPEEEKMSDPDDPYLLVDLNGGEPETEAREEEDQGEEIPMVEEDEMEDDVGEVDSQSLPFEVSDQEELPPVDAVSLDGEELVDEESVSADSQEQSSGNCPWCKENLPHREGVKFCPFCGSNVRLVPCPACGEELELTWRFCIACGTEIS
jgi:hypothetical protein